jgi:glucose-1-phosphate cytidylyltransferase|tara:strand:- start:239 stop:937 length:699 start_codon:yes stop_codon:yes gene_type:complete
MKIVILCGGKGTRLSEETRKIPKPMVKIGKKPILIHIMDYYKSFGFDNFILAVGYKQNIIRDYFKKNRTFNSVKVVDTGQNTLTGGRVLRLKKYFNKEETFLLTYGDGVTNLNLKNLIRFHKKNRKIATMTAVKPPVRFGELMIKKNIVKKFEEKPQSSSGWINGGFFVLNYKIFKYIKNDLIMLEREPLEKLVKIKQLVAYKHNGFWQCMDTLRDKILLNKIFKKKIPWKN